MNQRTLLHKLTLCVALLAAVAVAAPEAAAQAKKQVKISHATAGDVANDNHMTAWIIASYINSNSDTLEARVYPANQLGEERAVVEGMQLGAGATMHIGGTAIHNNFNKRMGVLDLPFMWRNYEHAHHVLDGKVGETLAAEHEKLGLKVLGWQDSWGYRNVITTKKEVKKPEDLKGLKIRTIQTPTYVAALNAMGASATPMAFGEVYTSLQTGVLDGFEHSSAVAYTGKFYEVAKYITLTEHLFGPTVTVISKKEWDGYTDKEKAVVAAAAKLGQDVNRSLSVQRDAESMQKLKDKGMIVNPIDKTQFQKAAGPLQDQLAKTIGAEDLLKTIRETK
ncbi:MAG: TRAP transporter substrate-binding protein [Burkholderiales bacterium]